MALILVDAVRATTLVAIIAGGEAKRLECESDASVPAVAERERTELDNVGTAFIVPAGSTAPEADLEEILAGGLGRPAADGEPLSLRASGGGWNCSMSSSSTSA